MLELSFKSRSLTVADVVVDDDDEDAETLRTGEANFREYTGIAECPTPPLLLLPLLECFRLAVAAAQAEDVDDCDLLLPPTRRSAAGRTIDPADIGNRARRAAADEGATPPADPVATPDVKCSTRRAAADFLAGLDREVDEVAAAERGFETVGRLSHSVERMRGC